MFDQILKGNAITFPEEILLHTSHLYAPHSFYVKIELKVQ